MLPENFHFLRVDLLWVAFLPLILLLFIVKKGATITEWRKACDKHLLNNIISEKGNKNYSKFIAFILLIAWLLATLAVSGFAWEKLPQPTYKKDVSATIILNMSNNMNVEDIKPSRLDRAKFFIFDLLKKLKGNNVSLIVYSGEAFVVVPFTDDANIIKNIMPSILLDIMPVKGDSLDKALSLALDNFANAKISTGDVFVVTPSYGKRLDLVLAEAKELGNKGFRVNVVGLGTKEGAPILDLKGGFAKDDEGKTIISKIEETALKEIAKKGNGKYLNILEADKRIDDIIRVSENSEILKNKVLEAKAKADIWKDMGVYLVPLVAILFSVVFRKGFIASLLFVFVLSFPDSAHAFSWNDLWFNKNQQAHKAFERKEYSEATKLFSDKEWKAVSAYKAKDFKAAEKLLENSNDTRSLYNYGNALAWNGKLEEALKAYEKALEKTPNHENAKYNYEYVKKLLEQQKQQQEQEQEQKNSNSQDNKKQENQKKQENSGQQKNKQDNQKQGQGEKQQNPEGKSSDNKNQKNEQKQEEQEQEYKKGKPNKDENKNKEQSPMKEDNEKNNKKEKQQKTKKEEVEAFRESNSKEHLNQKEEQLYSRIPDDAGGLLREMLRREYILRRNER